ncbi:MAG: hypothetical protein DRQ55_10245 [Planctomycetota bacterium]|nr:MAG: hypothetical protein DRQ55_10245 [Planctomycetota bacterium]
MRRTSTALRLTGLTLALVLTSLLARDTSAQVYPGLQTKFDFTRSLINGRGTTKLADLEGKLVWVEFWGTY